jgi:hypothetical protein
MKLMSAVCLLLILDRTAVAQQAASEAALKKLQASNPSAHWNSKSAETADVDCDGKLDTILLGSEGDKVVVGIVWGSPARPPQMFSFPINSSAQDGFCSKPSSIRLSALDCGTDGATLPGCKAIAGCKEFSIPDNNCDAFRFYWDSSRRAVAWWRR